MQAVLHIMRDDDRTSILVLPLEVVAQLRDIKDRIERANQSPAEPA